MRRRTSFFLFALAWPALAAASEVPSDWSHYAEVRPKGMGISIVTLTPVVLDRAATDLGDLRLLDPAGTEIPYRLVQETRAAARWTAMDAFAATLESSVTRLTGKAPEGAVDAIRLETPGDEFLKSVSLEVADGKGWKTLWKGRPVFRTRFGAENRMITFPARRLTQFRLTVDDKGSPPVPFTGLSARLAEDFVPPVEAVEATLSGREERPLETRFTLNLPARHVYIDELLVAATDPVFQRRVRVVARRLAGPETPDGGPQIVEELLGQATLYRTPGRPGEESLVIPLNRRVDTKGLTLIVTDGDAPPLAVKGVSARVVPTRLLFNARDASALRLAVGRAGSRPPVYDWPELRAVPAVASLGDLLENPAYVKPQAVPLLAAAGASFDGGGWVYRAPVELKFAGVQRLEMPLPVLVHGSSDGRDLRLMREGRQIPFVYDRSGIYHAVVLERKPLTGAPSGTTRWEIPLPLKGMPLTHLELWAEDKLFQRRLRVYEDSLSANGDRTDRTLAQVHWRRTGDDGRLVIPLAAPEGDRLVLEIQDGDNAPLNLGTIKAHYRTYELVFKADPGSPLWLYYGRPEAPFPVYDAALVAGELLSAEKIPAVLGAEERLKRRWSWDGGATAPKALFWAVLAAVTVALVLVIRRLLPANPDKP